MPGITNEEVYEVILKNLSSTNERNSIIYWDKNLLQKGDTVNIGKKIISMPFKGYMIFVDLEPKVNWGHPCLYFLMNSRTNELKVIKEEFPPYFEEYPESFKVIRRYGKKPPHDRYFEIFNEIE